MINFVIDPTPGRALAQQELLALLRAQLPERSCLASVRRYRLKRLNVAFGVSENADVLLPIGISQAGELAAALDDQGLPWLKRFRHVLVPDEAWRSRLLADPALGFTEGRLHVVGGLEPSAVAATLLRLAEAKLAAGTATRAERIPVF